MLYNNIPPMNPMDYEARKIAGLWDYKAYEDSRHLIEGARQSFFNGIDNGKLKSLCYDYGHPVEAGDQMVRDTLNSVFNLAFYESDRVHYHMLTYDAMKFSLEMVEVSVPKDNLREVQIYTLQLLRAKKEDESDIEKLIQAARPGDVSNAFTLCDIEEIKKDRFGDAKTYIDYHVAVMDLTFGLCDVVELAQKDDTTMFMGEFFREFTYKPYREMYVGVHTIKAEKMFPVMDHELGALVNSRPLFEFKRKVAMGFKSFYIKVFGK